MGRRPLAQNFFTPSARAPGCQPSPQLVPLPEERVVQLRAGLVSTLRAFCHPEMWKHFRSGCVGQWRDANRAMKTRVVFYKAWS